MATTYDEWKKKGFLGSAAGVGTYDETQEKIKALMNANSRAWHTADEATRAALHEENKRLAGLLGGDVKYDSARGTWSGQAGKTQDVAAPVSPATQPQVTADNKAINDYSWYLEQMHDAKKKAAVAMLDAAYEKNAAAINRAKEVAAQEHDIARNKTAGASELAKRNFAQYAAARGLNSGAGGQAELARTVALQGDLSAINAQEANALADLELQRVNNEADHNSSIAQAQANGDYELANALYKEKVRLQEANLEENRNRQKILSDYGLAFLKMGEVPSASMLAAMNMTEADAQRYIAALQRENDAAASKKMSLSAAKNLFENGIYTPEALQAFYDNGWSDAAIKGMYGYDPSVVREQERLAATIPNDVRNMLMANFPGGVITGDARWQSWVNRYGEDALRAAGFTYGAPTDAKGLARLFYKDNPDPDYVYRLLKYNNFSDMEIDAAMAELGL